MKIILLYVVPNIISFSVVALLYKKLHPQWLRLFIFFLFITLIESTGSFLYSHYMKKSNHFIENIYLLVAFSFYFLLFYKSAEINKFKQLVVVFFSVYILFALADMIFINGLFYFNTYSSGLGSILIILSSLLYFMRLFTSEKVMNYFRIPMFWIATGLLFFFTGSLVQNSLIRYFIANHIDPNGSLYYFIMVTLNIFLHSAFIISFLCNQVWKKVR